MAKIRLTTVKGKYQDKDVEISTVGYIKMVLETGSDTEAGKGITYKEILSRARVDRQLENVKEEDLDLTLEGDNLTTVQKAFQDFKWSGRNPILTNLIVDLFEVSDTEVAPEDTKETSTIGNASPESNRLRKA